MNLKSGFLTEAEREELAAETARLNEVIGDFYSLAAYPWFAEADREDGSPREANQERRDYLAQASRYWRVIGFDDGLPRISDRDLYVELLLMTLSSGLTNRVIDFTYRDLVSRLGLKPIPQSYKRIELAIKRLTRVRVVFFGRSDEYGLEANFNLVTNLDTVVERDETNCSLRWDELVWASFISRVESHRANFTDDDAGPEATHDSLRPLIVELLAHACPE